MKVYNIGLIGRGKMGKAFQEEIEKLVALAVLMPIVASMGGNAGTQTVTVAVRALATRQLNYTNLQKFVLKETWVGLLNGILFALLSALLAYLWFDDKLIAIIMGLAMIANLLFAGICIFIYGHVTFNV